jgi:hypothetical protein
VREIEFTRLEPVYMGEMTRGTWACEAGMGAA